MRRKRLLLISAAAGAQLLVLFSQQRAPEEGFDPKAVALVRWEEARGEGIDLSLGPCFGLIGTDWVADVVHDPRQPVDDEPGNQCMEYQTGRVKHFVELTPNGAVVRVK